MSLQAVGWISTMLGINIDGRTDSEETENKQSSSPFTHSGSSTGMIVDTYLHKLNDAVFGRDDASSPSVAGGGAGSVLMNLDCRAPARGDAAVEPREYCAGPDEVQLDENGLPVTTNWYYYDKALNRWNVSPDAPEAIREEFQRRLQEEEDERNGRNAVPPPPPPPPPPLPSAPAPPLGSAPVGHFPPGAQPPQRGMFSKQANTGLPQQTTLAQRTMGPQYAMPTYFNTTGLTQAQKMPQAPQQAQYPVHQSEQQGMPPQISYDLQQHQQTHRPRQDVQYYHQQHHQQHGDVQTRQEFPQPEVLHPPLMNSDYGGKAYPSVFQGRRVSNPLPHEVSQSSLGDQQLS